MLTEVVPMRFCAQVNSRVNTNILHMQIGTMRYNLQFFCSSPITWAVGTITFKQTSKKIIFFMPIKCPPFALKKKSKAISINITVLTVQHRQYRKDKLRAFFGCIRIVPNVPRFDLVRFNTNPHLVDINILHICSEATVMGQKNKKKIGRQNRTF